MKSRKLNDQNGRRTFVAVLETGDEVMTCLKQLAAEERLAAAQLTAIGALRQATVTYFDWETKKYLEIPVNEQVEVASLIGDIGIGPDGAPALHIHLVLGRKDGSAIAGHLAKAFVRPTLEVVISESPAYLRRVHDPETGLALIDPQAGA